MVDSETKAELNYIVWQYMQKESPSLAAKFKKSKKIKQREEAEVTLFSLYDLYIRNKADTSKRISESERELVEKSPGNKEASLCQDENNTEDSLTEVNEEGGNKKEIKQGNNKEDGKADEKSGTTKKKSEAEKSPISKKLHFSREEDSVENGLTEVDEKDVNTADSKEDEKSDDKSIAAEKKGGSKTEKSPANKKAKKKKTLKNKEDNQAGEKSDDESDAAKRKSEYEVEKLPPNKKARLSQEENAEDGLTEMKKEEINQEDAESDEEPSFNKEQKNYDKPKGNEKSTVSESTQSSEESSEVKSDKSESKKKRNKKSLLPKPRGKKTLLAIPFSSIHKNDPNFYNKDDRRKTLLPEPSPPVGPSGRKTLLTAPLPTYQDSERTRKTLLPEPLPPLPQHKRARMPLLGEPLPPPLSRSDRMDLLAESSSSPLYQDSKERVPLLSHPLESDQLDNTYRREKRPLLDGPRYMSPHNEDDDLSRNRRVLLPERPPLLSPKEFIPDLADHPDLSDYQLYCRGEAGSSSKPLIFNNEHQRNASSHLYFRRAIKEPPSEISSCEDKEAALLAKIKDYLKKLSRSSGNFSSIAERLTLMDRPTDEPHRTPHSLMNHNETVIQKYEEELRSIGVKMTSEISNTLRRATEDEFRSTEQELQYRLFERYNQKMGFL